jgi:DNA-binding cell septation regulator SpoVG
MGFDKAHKMAQRLHRERRQPEHRKKLGYLEKKQDYKKRALDHHTKAERIKKLKAKALERNPNEFHFHMINSRLVDGVHQDIVKPMDPEIKKKIQKKEELLKRYNESLRRKAGSTS